MLSSGRPNAFNNVMMLLERKCEQISNSGLLELTRILKQYSHAHMYIERVTGCCNNSSCPTSADPMPCKNAFQNIAEAIIRLQQSALTNNKSNTIFLFLCYYLSQASVRWPVFCAKCLHQDHESNLESPFGDSEYRHKIFTAIHSWWDISVSVIVMGHGSCQSMLQFLKDGKCYSK